jgi:hypothetical protein
VIAAAGCSNAPTARPPVSSQALSPKPKVIDIVGIREWKPSQESTLVCAATDDPDGTFIYAWSAEKGTIKGNGRQVTWAAPDSLGDYAITVKVSNTKGESAEFSKKFKVTDNPFNSNTADTTIYLKLALNSGNTVSEARTTRIWTTTEIECVLEGVDPATLNYQWNAPTGKLAGNGLNDGKASRVGWIAPGVAGQYKVSVTVTDKTGGIASGEVNFDILCCKDK